MPPIQSIVLGDRVDIETLLRDWAFIWLSTSHVEGHSVGEYSDLFESKGLVAPRAFSFIPNDKVCALEFSLFDLCVERLQSRQVRGDHRIFLLGHLGVEEGGKELDEVVVGRL